MLNVALVESPGKPSNVIALAGVNVVSLPRMGIALASGAMLLALGGCEGLGARQAPRPRPQVVIESPLKSDTWKQVATAADEDRIQRLGLAWQEALAQARRTSAGEVRREARLLEPRGALPRPHPTPGSYNCRLIKLGRVSGRGPAFERFRPFFCYVEVEDDLLTIVKQTGSERPAGRLWDDDMSDRLIFLGSLALGNEEQPRAYGDDPRRDMAGVFERIGPFRWRLVIPWPQSNSKLDVFELTPVADQPE